MFQYPVHAAFFKVDELDPDTAIVTSFAWIIEMVLFGVARHHMRDRGVDATWGNANWVVLGALVALFIAFFFSLCGSFGRYRKSY